MAGRIEKVQNSTGGALARGTLVYFSGRSTDANVNAAQANNASTAARGMLIAAIADGDEGQMMVSGPVYDVDTSPFSVGTRLYLDATTPGEFTDTPPSIGAGFSQFIGEVLVQDALVGAILVDIDPSFIPMTSGADRVKVLYAGNPLFDNRSGDTHPHTVVNLASPVLPTDALMAGVLRGKIRGWLDSDTTTNFQVTIGGYTFAFCVGGDVGTDSDGGFSAEFEITNQDGLDNTRHVAFGFSTGQGRTSNFIDTNARFDNSADCGILIENYLSSSSDRCIVGSVTVEYLPNPA